MSARDDLAFANNVRAALEAHAPRTAWALILGVLALLAAGLIWSSYAVIDEVTHGSGRVIPSQQLQVIQSLEGGIIRAINVAEGDLIEAGAVLAEIADTGAAARVGELNQRRNALMAEALRLQAEAEGATKITPPEDLAKQAPAALANEMAVFNAHLASLSQEIEILELQLQQKRQELEELKAGEAKIIATLVPLTRETELTRALRDRKVVPEIDLLRLERQEIEMQGDLKVIRSAQPRAQSAILEIEKKIETASARFQSRARETLAKTRSDLAVINETLRGAKDRVFRTDLRAPVRGIVNKLNITTIGAVAQPGQPIAEIVPIDDTLLIETKVRPQDVAFLTPNQEAQIKLTAYDYRKFGSLKGRVERISADTITDASGETFYRVIIRTDETELRNGGQLYPIIPGMVATVDILSGSKTVLDYLINPIARIRHEALREH